MAKEKRKQDQGIPHQIKTVDITPTDRCPLRCSFCYNTRNPHGTWDDARNWAILDFMLAQPPDSSQGKRRKTSLIWLGGEPLTHGEAILDFIDAARAKHPEVEIASSVTTNLVPMTKTWLERAKALRVPPHCSIDGIPEAHDLFRKFPDGKGSSGVVMRHARWVLDAFPNASMRATVTPENIEYMSRSIAWLAKFGFTDIAFSFASGVKWSDDALGEMDRQVRAVVDWWLECMRNGIHIKINWLKETLQYIWNPIRKWHICHAGVGRIAVATDGSLWPCHYFVGCNDERFRMGSIYEGLSEQGQALRKQLWFTRNQDPENHGGANCDECPAVNTCGKKCIHACWADTGDIAKEPHWFCRATRAYHNAALYAHAVLVREGKGQGRFYLQAYGGKKFPKPNGKQQPQPQRKPKSRIETLAKIPVVEGMPKVVYGTPVVARKADPTTTPKPLPAKSGYTPKSAFVLHWKDKGAPRALTEGLRAAGVEVETDRRESCSWASRVNKRLQSDNPPEWFVCVQRLYSSGQSGQVAEALRRQNQTRLLVMDFGLPDTERSHYQTVVFDPQGENATSSVARNFDKLMTLPTQVAAAESELPKVKEWAESLKQRAYNCNRQEIADLKGKDFAVFFAQNAKPDRVLKEDASRDHWLPPGTAAQFIKQCREVGLVPVIKPHPFNDWKDIWSPTQTVYPDATVLPNAIDDGFCAWLMLNAKATVLVNSTLVFMALALDAPTLQLGRGWCTGNNVVSEGKLRCLSAWQKMDRHNYDRRLRFLALMRSRQRRISDELRNPEIALGVLRFFDAVEREAVEATGTPTERTSVAPKRQTGVVSTPKTPKTEVALEQPLQRPKTVRIVQTADKKRVAVLARSITWPSGCSRRHIAIANWFQRMGYEVGYFVYNGVGTNRVGQIDCNLYSLNELAKWQPDIFITGWPMCVTDVVDAAQKAQRLFLLVSHDYVSMAKRLSHDGWLVAPISYHLADAFVDAYGCGENMMPVVNGVDLQQFTFSPIEGRNGVLWRDRSHRDINTAAKPPTRYPLEHALQVAFADLVPLSNLIWEDKRANGRVLWSEAHRSYQNARLLCLNETIRAGGNNTILEAAACGCPVIARRVPATEEMIEHGKTGWLCNDAEEIASLAKQLYDNVDKLAEVAKAARSWVEPYSWDNYCAEIERFVESNQNTGKAKVRESEATKEQPTETTIPQEVVQQLEKAFVADGGCFITVSYKHGEPPGNLKHYVYDGQYPEADKAPSLRHIIDNHTKGVPEPEPEAVWA